MCSAWERQEQCRPPPQTQPPCLRQCRRPAARTPPCLRQRRRSARTPPRHQPCRRRPRTPADTWLALALALASHSVPLTFAARSSSSRFFFSTNSFASATFLFSACNVSEEGASRAEQVATPAAPDISNVCRGYSSLHSCGVQGRECKVGRSGTRPPPTTINYTRTGARTHTANARKQLC